ncbi:MAG TPA: hypothetical protein VG013_29685 [Gemmataceae bacterium]|nr:hypothetical protein [Gemmataceae bacterium]
MTASPSDARNPAYPALCPGRRLLPAALAGLLAGVLLPGCGSSSSTAPANGNKPRAAVPGNQPAVEPGWTLDTGQMRIPEAQASGTVHGRPFRLDKATLANGVFTLLQGKGFDPDVAVQLFLFLKPGETPEGKTFNIATTTAFGSPHVHLACKEAGKMIPEMETFMDKYAMKLEFGKASEEHLPGKIYLCLPDDAHSWVAGTFDTELEADRTKPPTPRQAPWVYGRVTLKGNGKFNIQAGYVGATAKGEVQSNGAGMDVEVGKFGGWVSSTTFAPRISSLNSDEKSGVTFAHVRLEPGWYLVYVRWKERYLDWRWVEVTAKSQTTVDLTVDPGDVGALEVNLPEKVVQRHLLLIPLDAKGNIPDLKVQPDRLSWPVTADVPVKKGELLLKDLRPGRYRLLAGGVQADVTVKAKQTVKAELRQLK